MKQLLSVYLITATSVFGALFAKAADKVPAPVQQEKSDKKDARHIPFHGKIEAIDKTAKSIKVGERTFYVMADTKFSKAGKSAVFDDAKVGEEVGGAYQEGVGGKLQLTSLRVGPKPEAKKKVDEKK